MALLKLTALDSEDLEIISAHMQDATLLVGDISYLPRHNKLALVANRFDWGTAAPRSSAAGSAHDDDHDDDQHDDRFRRCRCGLQINRVFSVKYSNLRREDPAAVLSLLAILFHPGPEAPAGTIELTFSGGGAVRAEVECIEVALDDLGLSWETPNKPEHADASGED
jgi:hypothetical protein